jgi:hypothetical protein
VKDENGGLDNFFEGMPTNESYELMMRSASELGILLSKSNQKTTRKGRTGSYC